MEREARAKSCRDLLVMENQRFYIGSVLQRFAPITGFTFSDHFCGFMGEQVERVIAEIERPINE